MCILLTYTGNFDAMFLGTKANFILILGNIVFNLFDCINIGLCSIIQWHHVDTRNTKSECGHSLRLNTGMCCTVV
jgi:uncharacterized membrane protein